MSDIEIIEQLAGQYGLVIRGGFHVQADDAVPDLEQGARPGTLVLFGNAGSSLWQAFSASTEFSDGEPDSLDRWSERIGNQMAEQLGGLALFPFGGPPYQPFTQWAKKAESLANSKLGMLIHPRYGLWHAYRFAIAIPLTVDAFSRAPEMTDVCASCEDQPCLSQCPVKAFNGDSYDVESCYQYLHTNPDSSCRTQTCQARMACPEGHAFHYRQDHARFHMDAFYRNVDRRFGEKK